MPAPKNGLVTGDDGKARCFWGASDPLYLPYHDREWGFRPGTTVNVRELPEGRIQYAKEPAGLDGRTQ